MAKHSSRVRSPDGRVTEGFSSAGNRIQHAQFGQLYTSIERLKRNSFRVIVFNPKHKSYQVGNAKTEAEANEMRSRFLSQ